MKKLPIQMREIPGILTENSQECLNAILGRVLLQWPKVMAGRLFDSITHRKKTKSKPKLPILEENDRQCRASSISPEGSPVRARKHTIRNGQHDRLVRSLCCAEHVMQRDELTIPGAFSCEDCETQTSFCSEKLCPRCSYILLQCALCRRRIDDEEWEKIERAKTTQKLWRQLLVDVGPQGFKDAQNNWKRAFKEAQRKFVETGENQTFTGPGSKTRILQGSGKYK